MRIRTIKPEFWTDDAISECSLSARLLLIGTLNVADDEGNLERSAKQIKAKIFPNDSINCEPLLIELITQGLLIEYSVSDKKYLHIKGFKKHQVVNRASKPRCPLYDDSLRTHGVFTEDSLQEVEGKGREGKYVPAVAGIPASSENPKPKNRGNGSVHPKKQKTPIPENFTVSDGVKRWAEKNGFTHLAEHLENFVDTANANGYRYLDWDAAFKKAIRGDWAKLKEKYKNDDWRKDAINA